MPARVGVLKVTIGDGQISAEAGGNIGPLEWLAAIELAKARIVSEIVKGRSLQDIARHIAKPPEVH